MTNEFFRNKIVLVTGASRGLGKAMVMRLVREGAKVFALARNEKSLFLLKKEVKEFGDVEVFAADVSNRHQIETLLQKRPIDIAILNAGIKEGGDELFSLEKVERTVRVNFIGILNCLDVLLPGMLERKKGHCCFISSLGSRHGMMRSFGYNASKAALSIFVESLRMDLDGRVRLTLVEPGLIRTNMVIDKWFAGFFSVSADNAAKKILAGIARNRSKIAFPMFFHWLTLVMTALPVRLQRFVFACVK